MVANATLIDGARREIVVASVVVPVSAATYVSGQSLGGLLAFTLGDRNQDELTLLGVALADAAKQSLAADLVLFDQNPTGSTFTDAVAAAIVAADAPKVVDVVNLATASYVVLGAVPSFVAARNLRIPIVAPAGKAFWAALITRGAPTYTANCLTLKLTLSRQAP